MDVIAAKRQLRAACKAARAGLDPAEKRRLDDAVAARALALPELADAGLVLVYLSGAAEVGTGRILQSLWDAGKKTAAPVCLAGGQLAFYHFSSLAQALPGAYGIPAPDTARCRPAAPDAASVCLVPGLAFDTAGYRIGFGKGYYDRFLAGFPGVSVGLGYEHELARQLPRGIFDLPVDILVTDACARRMGGYHEK